MPAILTFRRLRQENSCELQDSLVYLVNARLGRVAR